MGVATEITRGRGGRKVQAEAEGAGSEERGDLRDGRNTDEVPDHKRGGEKKVPVNYDEEEEERHLD